MLKDVSCVVSQYDSLLLNLKNTYFYVTFATLYEAEEVTLKKSIDYRGFNSPSCQGAWWSTNRILPVAFTCGEYNSNGRRLEAHIHKDGLWGHSLLVVDSVQGRKDYFEATDSQELEGAMLIARHLASVASDVPFEDMEKRIVERIADAYGIEKRIVIFDKDYQFGTFCLCSNTADCFFSVARFSGGGLRFSLLRKRFIPTLLDRLGLSSG